MTDALTRSRNLDSVVSSVTQVCGHIVDPLEATAILESLGYTDARVTREFGLPDTLALGTLVFERLAAGTDSRAEARPTDETPPAWCRSKGFPQATSTRFHGSACSSPLVRHFQNGNFEEL